MLTIKNLSIKLENKKDNYYILKDVNLNLKKGKITALIGESGSGKTLTALSILRIIEYPLKITNGEIFFNNTNNQKEQDLLSLKEKEMNQIRSKDISMIFQEADRALNPVFTIGNQIKEILLRDSSNSSKTKMKLFERRNTSATKSLTLKEKVIELLKEVGIDSPEVKYNNYPYQLSGGMKQRVMIAMAIASKPKLIIADEATSALDVGIQIQILKLLKSLSRKYKLSILFISHNLRMIINFSDFVYIMYAGQVLEQAVAKDILSKSQHPYTKALLKCSLSIEQEISKKEKLISIEGNIPHLKEVQTGCTFYSRCSQKQDLCKNPIDIKKVSQKHTYKCIL